MSDERRTPPSAHREGFVYEHCRTCNRPPHRRKPHPQCPNCKGFGYMLTPRINAR